MFSSKNLSLFPISWSVSIPSSVTKTSPCSVGFIVPASTLRYGSIFTQVVLYPLDFKILAVEAAAIPLPMPDITPPITKINLGLGIKYLTYFRITPTGLVFQYALCAARREKVWTRKFQWLSWLLLRKSAVPQAIKHWHYYPPGPVYPSKAVYWASRHSTPPRGHA